MIKSLRNGFLAAVAFAATVAFAQTFTGSVQLSQDPRSQLPFDANGNIYLTNNNHFDPIVGSGTATTLGTCTGGTITAGSSDTSGQVTGGSATTCAVNFGRAYVTAPKCIVTAGSAVQALQAGTSTTVLTITATTTVGTANWFCTSVNG